MPGYRGHIAGGLITCFAIHTTAIKIFSHKTPTIKELALTLAFCVLGSLFPDIDTKSVGQRIFYTLLTIPIFFVIISKKWEFLAALSVLSFFPVLVNHRGIIHTPWFVSIVPLFIPGLTYAFTPHLLSTSWTVYFYFVAGAFSHLILDYGLHKFLKKIFR